MLLELKCPLQTFHVGSNPRHTLTLALKNVAPVPMGVTVAVARKIVLPTGEIESYLASDEHTLSFASGETKTVSLVPDLGGYIGTMTGYNLYLLAVKSEVASSLGGLPYWLAFASWLLVATTDRPYYA